MGHDDESQRKVAQRIAASVVSDNEHQRLLKWVQELIRIRDGNESTISKGRSALVATFAEGTTWPIVKLLATEIRRLAWDERGIKWRSGFFVALTTGILTGGQGAGIAALGGAICVPLWLVLGAGSSFLAMLYEELVQRDTQHQSNGKEKAPVPFIDVEATIIPMGMPLKDKKQPLTIERSIRSGDKLHCRSCGHDREITQTWLDTLGRRYAPTEAERPISLSANLLKRMTCSQCQKRDGLELQLIEDGRVIVQYKLCRSCGGDGGMAGRCGSV